MTRKTKKLDTNLNAGIVKESKHWVRGNEGTAVGEGEYNSPRISSEIPDCSMPMTFDSYSYCSLGCLYCFAYFFKSNNPVIKDVSLKAVNMNKMINALRGKPTDKKGRLMHEYFYKRKFLLHWGGLADPFCSFERKNKSGLRLIKTLGRLNYPTLFSFKGDTIFDESYVKTFQHYSKQKNFAFQVSIVTNSEKLSKMVEIGVPPTSKRIEAIKMLSDMGYYVILRLRPFIIGISDEGLDELLHRCLEAGIKGVSMEFFAMDMRANTGMKKRYDWMAKMIGVPNLMEYYKTLSPKERGGYMRLNRLVKEPYVKTVYKFCQDNELVCAISDPDFKELNTSGSCCGMPDNYPENRLLENWTTNQLTYHMKEARRLYHRKGEIAQLTFKGVYGEEPYLDEKAFGNDHVSVIGKCCAERVNLTQRIILQRHWNNLRSPASPRNYLHGKVMPLRDKDNDGNMIYRYNPTEYEARWKEEGIDLTR